MTAATPFAFERLAAGPCAPSGDENRDDDPVRDARRSTRHICWVELSPSCPGPQKKAAPEPTYTADQLAQAVDQARRETAAQVEADVRSALESSLEQRRCDMLAAVRDQLQQHVSAFEKELARSVVVAQELAIALAKAVIPRAIEREPLADIADALKTALARLVQEPSIELRLSPDLVDPGTDLLTDLAAEAGFRGEVAVIADPSLGRGDAVLCWKGGTVDRRLARVQTEAMDLVDCWLQTPSDAASGDDASRTPSASLASEVADGPPDRTDAGTPENERAKP